MSDDLLEEYIVQQIEIAPEAVISFFWHGGEPTILGLDYFRKIVALQRKHQPPDRRITNGIQTNGVSLDDDWCRFFAAENFAVGLSLDGPAALHDAYRVTKGQKPTHKQVMQGYRLLRQTKSRSISCAWCMRRMSSIPSRCIAFSRKSKPNTLALSPLLSANQ